MRTIFESLLRVVWCLVDAAFAMFVAWLMEFPFHLEFKQWAGIALIVHATARSHRALNAAINDIFSHDEKTLVAPSPRVETSSAK